MTALEPSRGRGRDILIEIAIKVLLAVVEWLLKHPEAIIVPPLLVLAGLAERAP